MQSASVLLPSLVISLGFLAVPDAWAQPGKAKGGSLALEGRPLPEVSGYDEAGEAFPVRQKLKGRHGVIVFGCLT